MRRTRWAAAATDASLLRRLGPALAAGQRLLFVDEWIDTVGQAVGVQTLVESTGAA